MGLNEGKVRKLNTEVLDHVKKIMLHNRARGYTQAVIKGINDRAKIVVHDHKFKKNIEEHYNVNA